MQNTFLESPVEYCKGVGPKKADLLKKELQIFTVEDFLSYYPYKYIDRSKITKISEIQNDLAYIQLKGRISNIQFTGKDRSRRMTALLTDNSGTIELIWFQGFKWLSDRFNPNIDYIIFGKPTLFNGIYNIPHPEIDTANPENTVPYEGLYPFYNTTEKLKKWGINSRTLAKIMQTLLPAAKEQIPETLTEEIISNLKLISREQALVNIHFPANPLLLKKAETRLKFEELFFLQLGMLNVKNLREKKIKGQIFVKVGEFFNSFYQYHLPFQLTAAQKRVVKEIRKDLGSGKQMNRLLQGDVGSGKTLVALMCMLIAADNGFQSCMMAPTEILATQHFATLQRFLNGMSINIALLTGSTKSALRKALHQQLENNTIHILIGTHALIEENVQFSNLGLVIIDEQHRFGVEQRSRLWEKTSIPPHVLVMTATPIPRTLAMTVYGDLDTSVIDELPPGRKSVKTIHAFENKRIQVYKFLYEKIKEGRQAYVVYPLIFESETLDIKHLEEGYAQLCEIFPDCSISMLHGQMKTADKEVEMQKFIKAETQILVATTVIEVGVDVPNASIMLIENAERFGLSQLHQLRGRVGRGAEQSFCILMSDYKLTSDARKRMEIMVQTTDGFEIAEADLKLRGPGDIEGTRQSGILDLKLADIVKDEKIVKYAHNLASEILNNDPYLQLGKNSKLHNQLVHLKREKKNWGLIS